jgi:hypothetical protein
MGSWHKQKQRAEDTLRVLYATRDATVFSYAAKHVTDFLINRRR